MVDWHFPMNYSFLYLPSYNIRCLTMNSGGFLLSRDRIGRNRLNQSSRRADMPPKESRYPINKVATMVAQSEPFDMIDLDTVQSLTHCLFGLSVKQRDDRTGVSTEKAHIRRQTNNIVVRNSPHPRPHSQRLLDNTLQCFLLASK